LIARLDLPLSFGESDAFEEYIKVAHNPQFVSMSRQTTSRDLVKYFSDRRSELMESLKSVSFVALTSDIWSGNAKEDYLSVVAHFVSFDWQLEKHILGMRLIDVSHTGDNIVGRVLTVLEEFGLTNKVVSVTLDNASSNTTDMVSLSPNIVGYHRGANAPPLTPENMDEEVRGIRLLHQRCACHIINLIVKFGLKRLKSYLEAFRTAIAFLNSSN
jgi:hypothetical protein